MTNQTTISLQGHVIGTIWMPACKAQKEISIGNRDFRFSDGGKPEARDFALKAIGDGDFQHCRISADSVFRFEKTIRTKTGTVSRVRYVPAASFKSIADCMTDEESLGFFED